MGNAAKPIDAKQVLFDAACKCMSPEQFEHFEAIQNNDGNVSERFLSCVIKGLSASRGAAKVAAHTPGPWHWDDAAWDEYDPMQRAPFLIPTNNDKGFVLMGTIKANSKADALLIAAAPELLEALVEVVGYIDREGPASKEWAAITSACEKAHAAIAKATGAA